MQNNESYLHPYENYLNPLNPEQWKPIKDRIYQVVEQTEKETLPDFRITNYLLEQLLLSQERFDELLKTIQVRAFFLNDFIPYICKSLLINGHYANDECLKLNNEILMNSLKIYDTLFFEDNVRLTEMFKLIIDPGKNQYIKNNQDEDGVMPLGYERVLSEQQKEWLNNLKLEDKIDCVRWGQREKWAYWSRGKIVQKSATSVRVQYLNEVESKVFGIDSIYLAPLGSRSKQFDWRLGLKKGDLVDAIDTANVWYNSTVISVDKDELIIAYRVYNENGEKSDEFGKFTGWSNKFDSKIQRMNPMIQPYNSVAKKYYPEASNTTDMFLIEDQSDIIFEEENKNRKIYAVTRPMIRSKTLVEMIQMLGERGFFDKIIKRISDQNNWCPIEIVNNIILGLKNVYALFYRDFMKQFLEKLHPLVIKNIIKSPDTNVRNFSKQKLDNVLGGLQVLLKRIYSLGEVYEIIEGLWMMTVLILFKSSYLERKIQAIKQLDGIINMAEFQSSKFVTKQKLMEIIQEKHLFTDIFDLKQHTSVIQRSSGLVKLLLQSKQLRVEDLEIMWRLAEKSTDCDMKQVVFKVLEEVSVYLGQVHLEFILKKVKMNLGMDEINLLYELSRFNIKDDSDIPKKIAQFLKDLMFRGKIEGELKEAVTQKFCGLMKHSQLKDQRINVLQECVEKYLTLESGRTALKVIQQLVETFPAQIMMMGISTDDWTKGKVVNWLWEDQQMADKLLGVLGLQVEGVTSFLVYFNSLSRRMNNKGLLGRAEFEKMWKIGKKDEVIHASEELMELMKEVVEMDGGQTDDVFRFFMEEIVGKEAVLKKVGNNAFNCFKVGFMAANEKVIEKEMVVQSSKKEQQQDAKFKVKVDPKELKWIEAVWKFLFVVEKEIVVEESIKMIRQLYLNISDELQSQTANIRKQLINACLVHLKSAINKGTSINRCFKLIKAILDETECQGAGLVLSHSCLIKGEVMGLTIHNGITIGMDIQKYIPIKIFSNATLLQLRGEIAQQAKCEWEEVNLKRLLPGQKKKVIVGFNNNGRTLAELGIKNGECLYAKKREIEPIPQIVLLTDDGKELIPKAKEIFLEMFKKFSTDSRMSMDQCGMFINSCTNDHCKGDDHRVKDVFTKYDDDKDGFVTEENFLQFYLDAAQDRTQVVWQNLQAHHIRNDLKKYSELQICVEIDESILPRYLISLSKEWYKVLFGILENSYSANQMLDTTALMAWELLGRLPLSPELLEEIVLFKEKNVTGWEKFLNAEKKFELLYTLSVMEFLMESQDVKQTEIQLSQQSSKREETEELMPINLEKVKSYGEMGGQWQVNFLTQGGFEHLAKIFFEICQRGYQQLSNCEKLIVSYSVQILKNYIIAIFYEKNKVVYRFNQLLRQTNLKLEELSELVEMMENSIEQNENTELVEIKEKMLETNWFLELVKTIQASEIQNKFDKILNVQAFEDKITELIKEVLLNSEKVFEREERLILEFGLTCMLCLDLIFGGKEKLSSKLQLLYQGLVFEGCATTRKLFSSELLIFSKYDSDFNLQFSEFLVKKLNQGQDDSQLGAEFYRLVTELLGSQMAMKQQKELYELFGIVLGRLWKHKSMETTEEQDQVLVGYLNLLEKLCKMGVIDKDDENLQGKLFAECLFFIKNEEQMQEKSYVKCQAVKTRELVSKLILELIAKQKNGVERFLQDTIKPFMKSLDIQANSQQGNQGSSVMFYGNYFEKRSPLGYAGLYNPSCICYMNAMLQQFFMVKAFRNAILLSDDKIEPQIEKVKYCGQTLELDDNLLHQLQKMFAYLKWSERMDYKPYGFCYAFKDFDGMPVNTSIQQDTQEFLNMIFDKLENSLKGGAFENILKDIFGGKIKYQMICSECGNANLREEDFYNLSLEVRNLKTIFESLDKLTSGEIISDYKCENCNKKVELKKISSLSILPNVLIVHLQRLVMNYDTMMNEKINSRLEFPEILDLQQYSYEGMKKKEEELKDKKKEDELEEQEQDDKEAQLKKEEIKLKDPAYYRYKLKGVVVHTGTADFGHYYSYIEADSDEWVEFNDSHIREFDKKKIGAECFGKNSEDNMHSMVMGWGWGRFKDNSKNAYILVYEKEVKDNVALKESEFKNDQLEEVIGVKQQKEMEFDKLASCEPRSNLSEVWKDNYAFMMDHHLYSQQFINFTKQLIDLSIENQQNSQEGIKILVNFLMKFLFEVACCTTNNNAAVVVNQLSNKLIELIEIIPLEAEAFVENFLLKQFDTVINFLVVNADKSIRKTVSDLILWIMNFCVNKYKIVVYTNPSLYVKGDKILWDQIQKLTMEEKVQCEIVLFLDLLLNRIPLEVTKNFLKLESYFNFWYEFIQSGSEQEKFGRIRDILSIFGDFLLQKHSPVNLPYFSNRTVSLNSRMWISSLDSLINTICFLAMKTELSSDDQLILKCPELYSQAIASAVSSSKANLVGDLIVQSIPKAPEISRSIITTIIKNLNHSNSFDEFCRYMDLIDQILSIEDAEQQARIEMILGIPQLKINKSEIQSSFGITNKLDTEIYEFISPILTDYYKQGLLSLLLINQQRWDYLTLAGLSKLLQIALKNKKVLEYLIIMPPISLIYNHYFDWFQSFINNYIVDCERNPHFTFNRSDIAEESQKSLELFLAKIEKEYKDFKSPFDTYIIGKPVNNKLVSKQQLLDEQTLATLKTQNYGYNMNSEVGVFFEVYESEVYYAKGMPQNYVRNKIFPQEIMDQDMQYKINLHQLNANSNILNLFNSKLPFLVQTHYIYSQKKNTNQQNDLLDTQQQENDHTITLNLKNLPQMQDQDDYQNDDFLSQEAVQGDEEQDVENIDSPVQGNPPPPPQNQQDEDSSPEYPNQEKKILRVQTIPSDNNNNNNDNNEEKPVQNFTVNLQEMMTGPIIRQYIIKNQTNKMLTFRFSLHMDGALKEKESFYLPVSKIEFSIKPQTFEHVLILQRPIPFEKLKNDNIWVWPELTIKLNLTVIQKSQSTQYYPYGQGYQDEYEDQSSKQFELSLTSS